MSKEDDRPSLTVIVEDTVKFPLLSLEGGGLDSCSLDYRLTLLCRLLLLRLLLNQIYIYKTDERIMSTFLKLEVLFNRHDLELILRLLPRELLRSMLTLYIMIA